MEANKKFPFYSSFSYRKSASSGTYITIQFICNKQGLLLKCDEELNTLYVSQEYIVYMYLYNFSFPANLSTSFRFYAGRTPQGGYGLVVQWLVLV